MDNYEKWAPKPPPKTYGLNFVGVCNGYLFGRLATLTVQLNAASLENAKRMFDEAIGQAGFVNPSDYHVCRKD